MTKPDINDINADLPRLIREVKASGFRISNMAHRADGMSQANLRSTKLPMTFHWGYGPCFVDALQKALDNARKGKIAATHQVGDNELDPRKICGTADPTDPIVKHARWFYHPESDSLSSVLPGEEEPSDPLAQEITYEEYQKIQAKQEKARLKAREKEWAEAEKALACSSTGEDDDLIGGGAPAAVDEDDELIG